MVILDGLKETQADYMAASPAIAILVNRTWDVLRNLGKQRIKKDTPFFSSGICAAARVIHRTGK